MSCLEVISKFATERSLQIVENQVRDVENGLIILMTWLIILKCSPGAGPLFVKKDGNPPRNIAYRISHIAEFQHRSRQ